MKYELNQEVIASPQYATVKEFAGYIIDILEGDATTCYIVEDQDGDVWDCEEFEIKLN